MPVHEHDLIQEIREFTEAWRNGTVTRRDGAELAHSLTGAWCEFETNSGPIGSEGAPSQELTDALKGAEQLLREGNPAVAGSTRDQISSEYSSAGQPTWVKAFSKDQPWISGGGQQPPAGQENQTNMPGQQPDVPKGDGQQPVGMAPPQPAGAINIAMIIQIITLILQNLDRFKR